MRNKYVTKLFDKEDLLLVMDADSDKLTLLLSEISDNSRWSIHHRMVFKDDSDGKCYESHYSVGATESQDERPYEFEGDQISCVEVEPVVVQVTQYKKKISS